MVNTNGGVFGEAGGSGLSGVLPQINEEGFEDLGGPGPDGAPPPMGAPMPPMMPGPMPQGVPRNIPGSYPIARPGMGQTTIEATLPSVTTTTCPTKRSAVLGFLMGVVTSSAVVGAYCLAKYRS